MKEGTVKKQENLDELINIIRDLVAIPSYRGIVHQERQTARYIHSLFQAEGIDSWLEEIEDGRENVIAHLPGKEGAKKLLLTGHLDTVPPYDMEDPLSMKCDETYLYGRGVVDMKGPLACMIYAMILLKRNEEIPACDLYFAGVIDEEEKSLGTIALLESEVTFDAAIVGEPTNLTIATAHRGLEWITVDFIGKAVHGGAQEAGNNAIEMASDYIQLLKEKLTPVVQAETHPLIGSSSYNLGKIEGGTQPSTVAGACRLIIDRRWVPGVSHSEVMKQFQDILNHTLKNYPGASAKLEIMPESLMKEGYVHTPLDTSIDEDIVKVLQHTVREVTGKESKISSFPAWSDGGLLYTYADVPTVVFAPGDLETAHAKEERIEISQLLPAVEIYLQLARYFG